MQCEEFRRFATHVPTPANPLTLASRLRHVLTPLRLSAPLLLILDRDWDTLYRIVRVPQVIWPAQGGAILVDYNPITLIVQKELLPLLELGLGAVAHRGRLVPTAEVLARRVVGAMTPSDEVEGVRSDLGESQT